MNRAYMLGLVTILVILFLVVPMVSFSADGNGKLVVASLDVAGPSSSPEGSGGMSPMFAFPLTRERWPGE